MHKAREHIEARAGCAPPGGSAAVELRQTAMGVIYYYEHGKEHRWCIGCMAWETEEHLKKHLAVWKPNALFERGEIVPDKKRGILELARDSVDNELRNGRTCPNDTDGDGDCGRPMCPICGIERQNDALCDGGPQSTESK